MRRMPIQLPRSRPYFAIACSVYLEQVGSYRQLWGNQANRIR
jgi:hypothetical protein